MTASDEKWVLCPACGAKTRLRLLPPLILTADDVAAALATLRRVLENTRS